PPPPPPPPPQAPDLAQMLADVKPTRQQVGAKVKFITPTNAKGVFLGEGETINGVTIETISRTEVVFSFLWKEMNKTLTLTKARE
ncbi:MAG TPA: hypothetical protein PKN92_11730, partial [Candidatus Hydrogenedentes bacterium]|nr:hypothetical protein [Candidatus Hydrogenedentota bacterium]